ncbi:MAG: MFS transporter [Bacteroidales bacterium]|nr:MFS transporter [Bacteroidales bacterium]
MLLEKVIPKELNSLKDIFSSLRSRNYRLYFFGQGFSLIGTWMQNIALSWLVYRLTGSVFLLGLIGFTTQIPTFILTPFTGVLTDRYNRHKIMVLAQVFFMLQAFAMAFLVLFNLIDVWHIIVLSLVFGVISAFDAPARQSLVIDLIDKPEDLGNAIALNSALFNGARLIGPAIAGLTIAAVGEGICFLLNALSFLAVIIALMQIKIPHKLAVTSSTPFGKSFREGLNYTFRTQSIRKLILLLAMMSLAAFPFIVLLPAYAKEVLGGGSETLGFLMSALGGGALVGALYMASRRSVKGLDKIISVNTVLLGASIVLTAFSHSIFLSLTSLAISGLTMILALSSINTLLQTTTEESKRGRVMSFYAMALMGTQPIGNLIAGSIASGTGIPVTLILGGTITVGAGIWYFNRSSKTGV